MSLAGFKKQLNKANQYVSEKVGGAKGTELDVEFTEMERKIDVTGKLAEELVARTHEVLQPNPVSRAKLSAVHFSSKARGMSKNALYPQPEGLLGECMTKYGRELGEESPFGGALVESGEAYKQMADVKYALEDNVKQNFIEPLHHLQTKDLKEVNHHRKKLSGRRLDYDCKKRKQAKDDGHDHHGPSQGGVHVSEEDISNAEEKFEESKQLAETAMYNLLENDVEQISQLSAFIEAQLDYHRQCADVLQSLAETLHVKNNEAASKPRREYVPKRVASTGRFDKSPSEPYNHSNNFDGGMDSSGYSLSPAPKNNMNNKASEPCVKALYDFDPENEGELGFKEGDLITLTSKIDENWYEGSIHGQTGFFPINYVEIVVDLP